MAPHPVLDRRPRALGLDGELLPPRTKRAGHLRPGAARFLPVMVAVACLPIYLAGDSIARWGGLALLGYHLGYTALIVLQATEHDLLGGFRTAVVWFALPLTALTLLVVLLRSGSGRRRGDGGPRVERAVRTPGRGSGTRTHGEGRVQNWVVDVVGELGVVGIGLLMFAENLFPPLPSEVIMPLAGYLSAREQVAFWPSVLAGSVGSLAGATLWYWLGRRITHQRLAGWIEAHGAWLAMTREDVDGAVRWFHGHGRYSVLLGRLMPLVRTLISVPAGFSRMGLLRFLVLSAVGTVIWTGALAFLGRFLGQQFHQVERYVGPVSWIVIAAAVVTYFYRVIRIRRAQRRSRSGAP